MDIKKIDKLVNVALALEEQAEAALAKTKTAKGNKLMATIQHLEGLLEKAHDEYETFAAPFTFESKEIFDQAQAIKDKIALVMLPKRTALCSKANVEIRITKTLRVKDVAGVVRVLGNNNALDKGIQKFNLKYLRKLKDIDLLDHDTAAYENKPNVYIRPLEGGEKSGA